MITVQDIFIIWSHPNTSAVKTDPEYVLKEMVRSITHLIMPFTLFGSVIITSVVKANQLRFLQVDYHLAQQLNFVSGRLVNQNAKKTAITA